MGKNLDLILQKNGGNKDVPVAFIFKISARLFEVIGFRLLPQLCRYRQPEN